MIWVAEIGSAHGGDRSLAFELIRQAKMAGATIAKFQLGWTPSAQRMYAGNVNNVRYIDHWAKDLKEWCDHFDIEFMASIWSEEGLQVARDVGMKRYKIAHQMGSNSLLEEIKRDDKTIFCSANPVCRNKNMKMIYCSSEYPAYSFDLPESEGWDGEVTSSFPSDYYGYSSHMHGIADALIAVSRGAKYIEKHVTLNKADKTIRDHSFALDFSEFKQMVEIGNEIARLV